MSDNLIRRNVFLFGILVSMLFSVSHAFASETNGTIDTTDKYAWGENIGWINFGCSNCSVSVTDQGLTGNAWSPQYGWINLDPLQSGVENNAEGVLSGFAWSSNLGWIDFTGVTINSSGEFLGYATIKSDSSQINLNCINGNSCSSADFKVKTDWRPASLRRSLTSGSRPIFPPTFIPPTETPPLENVVDNFTELVSDSILNFFNLFNLEENNVPNVAIEVPKIAPLSFKMNWNLLPIKAINAFVFAPLPYEIRTLASKFPELDKTLKSVGVERFTDMSKLTGATLNIPGLANILDRTIKTVGMNKLPEINNFGGVSLPVPGLSNPNGKIIGSVGAGKIALTPGLPLANFSLVAKKNLPSEFVFARTAGELVDLNVALSVGDKGEVTQQTETLPGQIMRLVVKPISKARSVTGYFVFKSTTPKISKNIILRSSLTASALFSMKDLVETNPEPVAIENKLVLSTFEYTDPDHDGIYTADVVSPVVPGSYEIITVIDYIDPVLGVRQMRMIAVIDPEGYIYEKNNGKETRIPNAIISLYVLDLATKKYELWPAKEYQQENPQVTDVRGTYSFLVPSGTYYFSVEAPGYDAYQGKAFVVQEGGGIHQNIELSSGANWLAQFDWKTILLIVVFLLLVYNLFKDKLSNFFRRT